MGVIVAFRERLGASCCSFGRMLVTLERSNGNWTVTAFLGFEVLAAGTEAADVRGEEA